MTIVVAVGYGQLKKLSMNDYDSISKDNVVLINVKEILPDPVWRL